jgi:tetratricopeptide (TPR) repeat protein
MRRVRAVAAAVLLGGMGSVSAAEANAESAALRARGAVELYNLDRERALATYRSAIAADPDDAAAYRGLASALWMAEAFRLGTMTIDSYLGGVSRANAKLPPPHPAALAEFQNAVDTAVKLARQRIAANARDADAHYQLGAAIGLRASYAATIQGSVRAAFGAAREAYDAHERVLDLDPKRSDAGLVVGTYRYVVSALSLPLRWVAYAAGFGGGRERGLRLIQGAANYPGDNQTDARLALVLIYNRERRYDEALAELARLRAQYPSNRLLWLESGSTALRGAMTPDAERFLTEGLDRMALDTRPRMFGEEALWYYKRGLARASLGRAAEATADLKRALSVEGRRWVHGRSHLELGKLAIKAADNATARNELRLAEELCESDNDRTSARQARRLIESLPNPR